MVWYKNNGSNGAIAIVVGWFEKLNICGELEVEPARKVKKSLLFLIQMKELLQKYADQLIVLTLALISLFISLPHLADTSLSIDEPFSVFYSQYDVADIFRFLKGGNNPPGYEFFLHFWMKVAGQEVFWLRFPSAVFWGLTGVALFQIGKTIFNRQVGVVGAFTFLCSNFTLQFAQQARAYALFVMLATWAFYWLIRYTKEGSIRSLVWLTLLNCLAAYIHFLAFIPILAQVVAVAALVRKDATKWKLFALSMGILLIAYLPMLGILYSRADDSIRHGTWVRPPVNQLVFWGMLDWMLNTSRYFTWVLSALLVIGSVRIVLSETGIRRLAMPLALILILWFILILRLNIDQLVWLSTQKVFIALSMVFIAGLVTDRWLKNKEEGVAHGWFWLMFSGVFVASFWVPMFVERYFYVVVPMLFLSMAGVFDRLLTVKGISAAWIFVVIMAFSVKSGNVEHRDIKGLAHYLHSHSRKSNTATVFCPDYFNVNLGYYINRTAFNALNPKLPEKELNDKMKAQNYFLVNHASDLDTSVLDNQDTVNYVDAYADFSYPGNGILQALKNRYQLIDSAVFVEGLKVFRFSVKKDSLHTN